MDLLKAFEFLIERDLKVMVTLGDKEFFEVRDRDKSVDLRIKDADAAAELLGEMRFRQRRKDALQSKGKMEKLRTLTDIAKRLEAEGYTLNVLNEDKLIMRIGKEAKPGLLSPFGPVEIRDIRAILRFLGD